MWHFDRSLKGCQESENGNAFPHLRVLQQFSTTPSRGILQRIQVGFCRQPHYCYRPYYPTARFRSPSSYVASDEPFPDRSRPMSCCLAQMGSRPITFLWLWPATDHEPHCRHVPINKIWRQTESTPWNGWWRSRMAGMYTATAALAKL